MMENILTMEHTYEREVRRNDTKFALNAARCELEDVLGELSELEEAGNYGKRYDDLQDRADQLEDEIRECKDILRDWC